MPDEKRVYKLLITKGIDPDGQYDFYKERIDSQRDFSYMEYNTEENELTDELFNDIDVIVCGRLESSLHCRCNRDTCRWRGLGQAM